MFRRRLASRGIGCLQWSPDGAVLAAGSHDRCIDLLRASRDGWATYARCRGHSATVLQMDFSADGLVLQTNCNAYECLHWDVATGRQLAQNQRDRRFATWTCRLGFPVMGIWPEHADGSDVNAVDRDPQSSLLVAADDFGDVRLFNWPCCVRGARCAVYGGHSSHVACVRFSADGRRVLSVGGLDRAAFQWRVVDRVKSHDGDAVEGDGGLGRAAGAVVGAQELMEGGAPHVEAAVRMAAAAAAAERAGADGGSATAALADVLVERAQMAGAGSRTYAKRRLAELKRQLDEELQRAGFGRPKSAARVDNAGRVWTRLDPEGRRYGWADAGDEGPAIGI